MTYRVVKDGPSFLVALDTLEDPPMSIVVESEPAFMTLQGAIRRRNQLEDETVALTNGYEKAKTQRPEVA